MSKEFTCKKSTVEKYDIRWNRGEWAIFTIDNSCGGMTCHSSYGDWNYSWPRHGRESFKHFILELEKDWQYLLRKVAKPVFDFDESVKRWKRNFLEMRRDGSCTKEEARNAYDVVKSLEIEDAGYCAAILNESYAIHEADPDFWELLDGVKVFSNSDIAFAKEIWPMLCKVLREELKEAPEAANGYGAQPCNHL